MASVTMLSKEKIYRDSKTWYAKLEPGRGVSNSHVNFFKRYGGKRVLDFGCATGGYCLELKRLAFECVGVDVNKEYVKIARNKGVEAYVVKEQLPFNNNSFDTVIMFELLEHVQNPSEILKEAKRVAKKNILITVPDCGGFEILRSYRLTYEHFLELDHINFFTKKDLENLLSKHFRKFRVEEREPILLGKTGLPWWLRKPISLLYKLKLIKPEIHYSIYTVIDLEGG